ncbi:MAG: YraN family protein [Candidatus Humimicrobiaceae bacterium]
MSTNNRSIGQFGEKIAAGFIVNSGNTIICRNYKCKYGEIDIISASKKDIVFTEVKTRQNINYGYPFESVTEGKLKKIKKVSQYFLLNKNLFQNHKYNLRFDIISIIISSDLAAAILAQNNKNIIDVSSLIKGTDYELDQITDI